MSTDRESLSRSMIAKQALSMTDEAGLAGLSMRKLGAALGVEAMSLYHYVANKDDLLNAVVEQIYLEVDLPEDLADDAWEPSMRLGLRAFHDVLLRHPAALELVSSRPAPSVEAYAVLTWGLTRFLANGLELSDATKALHLGISYVLGFTSTETGVMQAIRSGEGLNPDVMAAEQGAAGIRLISELSSDEVFESGLDALIVGLRATYDLP